MKVLLINPPFEHTLNIGIDSELMEMAGCFPPMGLLYIAANLIKNGFTVKLFDCPVQNISHKDLENYVAEFNPQVVGITTFTTTMYDVLICAKNIKSFNKNIKIVLGGHHVYSYPEFSATYPDVDFIIRGEAEYSFTELCIGLKNNCDLEELKNIKGLGFKQSSGVFLNPETAFITKVDELEFPARNLVNPKIYHSVFDTQESEISIISSRGCPFNCSFCFTPEKKYRSRSIENILDEITYLYREGFRKFFFFDDLFSINSQKIIDFSKAIIQSGMKIKWSFRGRIKSINEENIKIAKKAGLIRVQFGIETFDENVLNLCNKNLKKKEILRTLKLCKKFGIQTVGNFIIGLPGQTEDIVLNDLKIAMKSGLDFAEFNIFTPLPNTSAYNLALQKGIIKSDFWKQFAEDPLNNYSIFKMHYYTEYLSEERQFELCKFAFKKFYLRPVYVVRRLKTIRSFKQFVFHAKSAMKLLKFNPSK
ncbi:MAG TPA: radical SAM protein [Bacteroidales bacterium]|nr:radical SAM protein [Bacteroidales bacterium]HOL98424.1 radical SAM protein [Bacteroidales bacterium]HOM36677.1 radical SAM protein [Bacteroidales bacterium]HPD24146.1 radical SAM protein [Bacteroidales bacterium]HRT00133.1 radical SAM protein [Bacteroidales bacterium]